MIEKLPIFLQVIFQLTLAFFATYGATVMLDMVPAEHWGKPWVAILLFVVIANLWWETITKRYKRK